MRTLGLVGNAGSIWTPVYTKEPSCAVPEVVASVCNVATCEARKEYAAVSAVQMYGYGMASSESGRASV